MEVPLSRQLIVNADDYGRTAGIVQGILQAYREGIVTSTTAMMNMPGIEPSLRLARQESGLGLGVHLVFTACRPILPPQQVPSLVDPEGVFWRTDVWQSRPDHINLEELWAEWQAQLASFRDVAGQPDHLDCHHFVHLYPPIFEVYLRLARHEGLPVRVPFEATIANDEDTITIGEDLGLSPEVVAPILNADRDLLRGQPVQHPDHFFGGFYGDDNLRVDRLMEILAAVPEGISELMVHPGLADEELCSTSSYSWQRERELEILCHPDMQKHLGALDIVLVDFGILG